jgi:hypothetical protein
MAQDTGADTVIIDSLKDVALGLSDDEIGAGLNSAVQQALVDGVQVAALHHQRKGQAGARPRTLEDVYGSTWLVAGAGSVVLLWGVAGDLLVDLVHLKQPAAEVGPLKVEHDHIAGHSTVHRGVDVLVMLRNAPQGLTAVDVARATHGAEPTDNQTRKARRTLERLHQRGLLHRHEPDLGGAGGSRPARYHAIDQRRNTP